MHIHLYKLCLCAYPLTHRFNKLLYFIAAPNIFPPPICIWKFMDTARGRGQREEGRRYDEKHVRQEL